MKTKPSQAPPITATDITYAADSATLWDHYAAAALCGLLADPQTNNIKEATTAAAKSADAMLAERERRVME